MSQVDGLIASYREFVCLPWPPRVAPPQRVWMAVYSPEHERRVRLNLTAFESATLRAGHAWATIDITTSFERWMASHEYAATYFEEPELLETELPMFFTGLVAEVRGHLKRHDNPSGVVGLVGTSTLFGLGDSVRISALIREVRACISGRLLVFFPGRYEHDQYRLLDARDGWDYLATPITYEGAIR